MSAVVTQADRDRVAAYWMPDPEDQEDHLPWVRRANAASDGRMDDDELVQAFARHRTEATEELLEALKAIELLACNHSAWVENDLWGGLGKIREHARAAIARARGEQA